MFAHLVEIPVEEAALSLAPIAAATSGVVGMYCANVLDDGDRAGHQRHLPEGGDEHYFPLPRRVPRAFRDHSGDHRLR